jgi:hypothetical protein
MSNSCCKQHLTCSCSSSCVSPILELTGTLVNTSSNTVINLSLSKNFANQDISITYIYNLTHSYLLHESNIILLKTDQNSNFSLILPPNISLLEIKVTLKAYNVTLVKYFPDNTSNTQKTTSNQFKNDNLALRLFIQSCNAFTIDASGWDHANAKEQLGPCRAARAMAIVHIAMFEVYIAIKGGYDSYLTFGNNPQKPPEFSPNANIQVAMAQAMHDTLISLFPAQKSRIDDRLKVDLSYIQETYIQENCTKIISTKIISTKIISTKIISIKLGSYCAEKILLKRSTDNAPKPGPPPNSVDQSYDEYIKENLIKTTEFKWSKDPISKLNVALGSKWDRVTPFVLKTSGDLIHLISPPPDILSKEYAMAFDEVKSIGGKGDLITPTMRSQELTDIGIYWAYDGVPTLCAPPRMYNQIAMQLAIENDLSNEDMLRMLTLLNIAQSDSGSAAWHAKYFYKFWRPISGIRELLYDNIEAPTHNPFLMPDKDWEPLGAPATNSSNINFTPPFPALPSGHATFGGSLFQMLRKFLVKGDNTAFTFVSDELNGVTTDINKKVRPLKPRSFMTLSQAEEENAQSRMYLGIHWSFDKSGIKLGNKVADLVYNTVYRKK